VRSFPMRVILAALLVLLCVPAGALAHGDASIHYLETGSLYPGFGGRPSQATELKLMGLLEAAQQAGYPLKVSLLGDESDVSDHPAMFRNPQAYANFVAAELGRSGVPMVGPVLILSPYGAGIAGPDVAPGDAKRLLAGVSVPAAAGGDQLAEIAMATVRQVAATGGHPLPANVPPLQVPNLSPASTSGAGYDLSGLTPFAVFLAIFGSAVAYVQIRTRMARRRPLRGA
jgi:hypothetical protein